MNSTPAPVSFIEAVLLPILVISGFVLAMWRCRGRVSGKHLQHSGYSAVEGRRNARYA